MQNQNHDRPRWLDVHAAWQLLGILINSEPGQKGKFNQFHLDGNRIGYNTGCEAVQVVVTTRNFMDERREVVEAAKATEVSETNKAPPPLAVGTKVRIVNVERRSALGWQASDPAPVGETGTIIEVNDSHPAEKRWMVHVDSVKNWFYFASSELQVID